MRKIVRMRSRIMVKVGVHVSIAGSIAKAVERAERVSCDTFQIFSRNPRGWAWKDLSEEDIQAFRDAMKKSSVFPPVDHMPYLPNLAGPNPDHYEKSVATLTAELKRCGQLGIPFLVTHLGHHPGMTIEEGRKRVINAVNTAIKEAGNDVVLLLENTAGEKNGVGNRFEDIRAVLDGIHDRDHTGVCFDTCHAFGAGYDLRTDDAIKETTGRFDELIGLNEIRIIHFNDSKGELGSGLDRHEHIGMGHIGEEGFRRILRHEPFNRLPLVCETPVDARRDDAGNIARVRELAG
jgi:deoxyribonuclease IV